MERLLKDAQKFSGVKYDINNLADVFSAIDVIQGKLGITGTTAQEAATTIQGSAASMKAALGQSSYGFCYRRRQLRPMYHKYDRFGENVR